jgi:hypothetical protein
MSQKPAPRPTKPPIDEKSNNLGYTAEGNTGLDKLVEQLKENWKMIAIMATVALIAVPFMVGWLTWTNLVPVVAVVIIGLAVRGSLKTGKWSGFAILMALLLLGSGILKSCAPNVADEMFLRRVHHAVDKIEEVQRKIEALTIAQVNDPEPQKLLTGYKPVSKETETVSMQRGEVYNFWQLPEMKNISYSATGRVCTGKMEITANGEVGCTGVIRAKAQDQPIKPKLPSDPEGINFVFTALEDVEEFSISYIVPEAVTTENEKYSGQFEAWKARKADRESKIAACQAAIDSIVNPKKDSPLIYFALFLGGVIVTLVAIFVAKTKNNKNNGVKQKKGGGFINFDAVQNPGDYGYNSYPHNSSSDSNHPASDNQINIDDLEKEIMTRAGSLAGWNYQQVLTAVKTALEPIGFNVQQLYGEEDWMILVEKNGERFVLPTILTEGGTTQLFRRFFDHRQRGESFRMFSQCIAPGLINRAGSILKKGLVDGSR